MKCFISSQSLSFNWINMSFVKMLNETNKLNDKVITETIKAGKEIITEAKTEEENPTDVLRRNNFKIKLVTPISFGIQVDFAKQYDDEDITKALQGFNIKIKNKSVFIVS